MAKVEENGDRMLMEQRIAVLLVNRLHHMLQSSDLLQGQAHHYAQQWADVLTDDWKEEWEELLSSPQGSRLKWLLEKCGDLGTDVLCLALVILNLQELGEDRNFSPLTLEMVYQNFLLEPCSLEELRWTYQQLTIFLSCAQSSLPFYRHPFVADERLWSWICGDDLPDIRLRESGVTLQLPEEPLQEMYTGLERLDPLCQALEKGVVIHLTGEEGLGKKLTLSHGAEKLGKKVLFVPVDRWARHSAKERKIFGWLVIREALLEQCVVCLYGVNENVFADVNLTGDFYEQYVRVLLPLRDDGISLCFCTTSDFELIPRISTYVERFYFPPFTRNQRIDLWKGYAHQRGMPQRLDCEDAGSRFHLNGEQIRKAVERLAYQEKESYTLSDISIACSDVLPPPSQGNIKRIEVKYTLEDLKLPAFQKQKLEEICAHVRYRHLVYDSWNMESKFAYGRNVSALFVGPPGTGKTMAVHVISNMLGIPLYRIDLSQVVDKYIGETEKRLEEVFSIAEKNNTILFFDEADAIFGKRSEVNDAKDKYANTEVSYVLQRIEQYEGIVILATNYKKNIDEAFMRRMRYLVEFNLPGEELRKEIWMSSFSKEVPLESIDFDFLARQFELAGGSIKNIVLNAVFAAAQQQSSVTMKHILDSIRAENLKMGKSMLKQDFAEYGALYSREGSAGSQ